MIKTVSFAPPRAVSGATKSSSKAARSGGIQNARARAVSPRLAPTQPANPSPLPDAGTPVVASSVTSLFPKPSAPAEVSAAKAREQLRGVAPSTEPRGRSTSSAPVPTPDPTSAPSASSAPSAKRSPRRVAPSELSLDLFAVDPAPVGEAVKATPKTQTIEPAVVAVETSAVQSTAPQVAPAKRVKRAKVPLNLAEQYGQSLSKRVGNGVELPVAEEEAPKKRLNRAERAARRELMNPDDDLRARLLRAQNAVPSVKPEKRPRGWRFDCGRCGRTSYFETPGALCSCGALAIKE